MNRKITHADHELDTTGKVDPGGRGTGRGRGVTLSRRMAVRAVSDRSFDRRSSGSRGAAGPTGAWRGRRDRGGGQDDLLARVRRRQRRDGRRGSTGNAVPAGFDNQDDYGRGGRPGGRTGQTQPARADRQAHRGSVPEARGADRTPAALAYLRDSRRGADVRQPRRRRVEEGGRIVDRRPILRRAGPDLPGTPTPGIGWLVCSPSRSAANHSPTRSPRRSSRRWACRGPRSGRRWP